MRSLGGYFYLLALAVWVGGGALYTFVLTPAIFRAYPRNTAGDVVGTMMPFYFAALLAAAALASILLVALRRSLAVRLPAVCLALALAALGVQAYVQWRLYPQILAVKAQVASFEADSDAPSRRRFSALHGTSMFLNLLTLADGAALLALVPLRRP
ncbi:MAG TPA: DUF4149 domain-containing protein [Candidatus Methanoperedens sp.]|nr:DUF4149 domain-containing protein [Candidatus Methanoperedens sp.]